MDPERWGPYGWRVIHAYSKLPVSIDTYKQWLIATAGVLPCRKCRRNFRRHLRGAECKDIKSPAEYGICLHETVSEDLGKKTAIHKPGVFRPKDLPEPTKCNLLQPMFWMTMATNTMEGKNRVIRHWLCKTIDILKESGDDYLEIINHIKPLLDDGCFGLEQNKARRRHFAKAIRKMLDDADLKPPSQEQLFEKLGKKPPMYRITKKNKKSSSKRITRKH